MRPEVDCRRARPNEVRRHRILPILTPRLASARPVGLQRVGRLGSCAGRPAKRAPSHQPEPEGSWAVSQLAMHAARSDGDDETDWCFEHERDGTDRPVRWCSSGQLTGIGYVQWKVCLSQRHGAAGRWPAGQLQSGTYHPMAPTGGTGPVLARREPCSPRHYGGSALAMHPFQGPTFEHNVCSTYRASPAARVAASEPVPVQSPKHQGKHVPSTRQRGAGCYVEPTRPSFNHLPRRPSDLEPSCTSLPRQTEAYRPSSQGEGDPRSCHGCSIATGLRTSFIISRTDLHMCVPVPAAPGRRRLQSWPAREALRPETSSPSSRFTSSLTPGHLRTSLPLSS